MALYLATRSERQGAPVLICAQPKLTFRNERETHKNDEKPLRKIENREKAELLTDEVSDGRVLGLSRSVGDHDTPSVGLGKLSTSSRVEKGSDMEHGENTEQKSCSRLDRLGDGTDLVDLEEETVASLLLDGAGNREATKEK